MPRSDKNWLWFCGTSLLFIALFYIHYIFQFSLSDYEIIDLRESIRPLYEVFYFETPHLSIAPDRGLLFTSFVRTAIGLFSENIYGLRLLNLLFFIGSLFVILSFKPFAISQKIIAVLFLSFNFKVIFHFTSLNHYGMGFFFCCFLYKVHFEFSGRKNDYRQHALFSTLSIMTIYTSALPVLISSFLIYFRDKNLLRRSIKYYIPLILYSAYKLVMVLEYRFVDLISYRGRDTEYIYSNFLILFNITDINFLNLIYLALLSIILILSLTLYFRGFQKNLLRFHLIYFLIYTVSFVAFNLYGADEIDSRYYLPYLVIFYLSVAYVLSWFLPRKAFLLITLPLIILNFIIGYQHSSNSLYQPAAIIHSLVEKVYTSEAIACFSKMNVHSQMLTDYHYTRRTDINFYKDKYLICETGQDFEQYPSINVFSNSPLEDPRMICADSPPDFCKNRYLREQILARKIITEEIIDVKRNDLPVYIYRFSHK